MNIGLLARAMAIRVRIEQTLDGPRQNLDFYRGDLRAILYAIQRLERQADAITATREGH